MTASTETVPLNLPMTAAERAVDEARVGAAYRLSRMRELYPDLRRRETQSRLDLAAAVLALDEAEEHPEVLAGKRHTMQEQVSLELASSRYARALADLLRGELNSSQG